MKAVELAITFRKVDNTKAPISGRFVQFVLRHNTVKKVGEQVLDLESWTKTTATTNGKFTGRQVECETIPAFHSIWEIT